MSVRISLFSCSEHGSGVPSRVDETGTGDPTSTLIHSTISTMINGTTSMSTNSTTSASIDGTPSESIDITISASIDINSCCRSTPIEIPERSSCTQDIADSTLGARLAKIISMVTSSATGCCMTGSGIGNGAGVGTGQLQDLETGAAIWLFGIAELSAI
ncbi:hypothetical protein DY000_02024244 [Brassica cretica]|uniref:VAN3-binding protein-like auxin canalisation domain-containing protein n=1 Tax=Brassica cretica TaxID=69181 RepID=A0ABQ7ECL3_BRACR|nr:hypothetical protein DY000_02024244 [Brassica cretica]